MPGAAERGSWTTVLKPGVRLVALDSNVTGDWGGRLSDVPSWPGWTAPSRRPPSRWWC